MKPKIRCYYTWKWNPEKDNYNLTQDLLRYRNTKFLLIGPEEAVIYKDNYFQNTPEVKEIIEHSHNIGNEIHAVFSDFPGTYRDRSNSIDDDFFHELFGRRIIVHPFNTWFFSEAIRRYFLSAPRGRYPYKDVNLDIAFCCLNHREHQHRLTMMDKLAKYKILEDNLVSWLAPGYYPRESCMFDLDYWEPKQIILEETVDPSHFEASEPVLYKNCFAELVTESSELRVFITEKTARPIFSQKPFLVYGGVGFHQQLSKLGFLLYDEIFDYSFDAVQNHNLRAEMIAIQMKKIQGANYAELYDKIRHKLSYNLSRWLEIVVKDMRFPNITKQYPEAFVEYMEAHQECVDFVLTDPYLKDYL